MPSCGHTQISLIVRTQVRDGGTILYSGPFPRALQPNLTDFMLLELVNGKPRLHLNLGGGATHTLQLDRNIADNKDHLLEISWKSGQVKLELDPDTCMNDIINYRNLQAQNDNSGSRYANASSNLKIEIINDLNPVDENWPLKLAGTVY